MPPLIELLTIGTELLSGRKADAHGPWLARALSPLGLRLRFQTHVADIAADIETALRAALSRSELVIACGGLGPTVDDLTREAAARVAGCPLREDAGLRSGLEQFFRQRDRPMPGNNLRQALVPEGAEALPNPEGTAPGLRISCRGPLDGRILILLPGPPKEMHAVFEGSVLPWLARRHAAATLHERILMVWGLSESAVDQALKELGDRVGAEGLALLAHGTHVEVRLNAAGGEELAAMEREAGARLGGHVFSAEGAALEAVVLELLKARPARLALAESCTGGRIASRITAVPGASKAFQTGFVTYSDEAKVRLLDVPPFVLKRSGAVSKETALAMAVGLARKTWCEFCLAATGIAGPDGGSSRVQGDGGSSRVQGDGGSAEKPVGLVHLALASPDGVFHQQFMFGPAGREEVQERAAMAALFLLYRVLIGLPVPEQGSDRASLPGDPAPA